MSTQDNPTTSLTTRQRVPFEKEVLKFLLKHEANIVNAVVRSFVRRYVKWLYDCVNCEVPISPGGGVELARWTTPEGGSYGYDPASIAYYLHKLNQLFFLVVGNAYIRTTQKDTPEVLPSLNMQFSIEMFKGLSSCLGYYVLAYYFATGTSKEDEAWLNRVCDLFGEFRDLETWRPAQHVVESAVVGQVLGSALSPDEPYYHTTLSQPLQRYDTRNYKPPVGTPVPQIPNQYAYPPDAAKCYQAGYTNGFQRGHEVGYKLCVYEANQLHKETAMILECERKRLVDFMRSLRQTLDVLNDDPLMVEYELCIVPPEGKPINGNQAD